MHTDRAGASDIIGAIAPSNFRLNSSKIAPRGQLFERSEFLIATCKKRKTDRLSVCPDVRLSGCSVNLGFSVRSGNRIRPKHGIPLSKYIVF